MIRMGIARGVSIFGLVLAIAGIHTARPLPGASQISSAALARA